MKDLGFEGPERRLNSVLTSYQASLSLGDEVTSFRSR
jgi:hypothetical protein